MNVSKNKTILYHGSPNQNIVPTYGLGEERHDYGKGFYLTEKKELEPVDYHEFNQKYNKRDVEARERMKQLINSEKNKVQNVFSTLV